MALEGTVKVPGLGTVPKKELAIGGVIVGTLVVVYYVRNRSASSSAAAAQTASQAASTTDQYPPDGTVGDPSDPYSTDPATNQTYGNEAAGSGGTFGAYGGLGSSTTDAYPWDGTYGNSSDPYSIDTSTGLTYGDEGLAGNVGSSGSGSGGPPFTSNSAWANWVLQQEQTIDPSADLGSWQDALGLYLQGQPVSPAQKTIVFDAIAIGGDPPDPGTNNYPPNVRSNGTKGPGGQVTVPATVGETATVAGNSLKAAGLGVKFVDTSTPGATNIVTATNPPAGAKADKGTVVNVHTSTSTAKKPPEITGPVKTKG